jgi:hypothetical protein
VGGRVNTLSRRPAAAAAVPVTAISRYSRNANHHAVERPSRFSVRPSAFRNDGPRGATAVVCGVVSVCKLCLIYLIDCPHAFYSRWHADVLHTCTAHVRRHSVHGSRIALMGEGEGVFECCALERLNCMLARYAKRVI